MIEANNMQENNTTTVEEVCRNALNETVACVSGSSSLLDDIEVLLVAIAALLGIAAWAYKKYQTLNADGSISLDEVIDSMDEVKEKAAEAKAELETIEETLESHNVAELKAMLKEKGLAVSGKKAELVARLKASMGEDGD
tara:strand:+ start:44 stop:463 length:420 start_codon:yes stop_codon:yes gene_type:complete